MKIFFKRFFITISCLLLIAVATPFLFIQFGSESAATTAKVLMNAMTGFSIDSPDRTLVESRFRVPEGFSIDLYATGLGKIRFMHMTDSGDLIVSRPREGDLLLLERDANGDGKPDAQRVLLDGLVKPHGLDIADGWLYIAESTAIGKVRYDQASGTISGEYQQMVKGLSDSGNHWTKTVGVGPDGLLYLTSGSSCNVCEEEDNQRATMMRVNTDGTDLHIYASGLRNSVGFDWTPWDQALYATDNGRDLLGDDIPPCELNKIESGGFYGWPYIYGRGQLDPDLGQDKQNLMTTSISPAHDFRAHNAPLGIRFLQYSQASGFERSALVALHGSWNRSERDGYKVISLHWQDDGSIVEKDFLTGFKGTADVIGRPVDVAEGTDGTVYVSDDYSGTIFKVTYGQQSSTAQVTQQAKPSPPTVVVDPDQVLSKYTDEQLAQLRNQGKELYTQYRCGNCHGSAQGSLKRSMVHLEQIAQRYSLDELANFFLTPTPPMPVYPLNAEQREALAALLYTR
jgi:glucose/arabinose dehydrogenase